MKLTHILEARQFKDAILREIFSLADEMKLFDKTNLTEKERKRCHKLKLSSQPRKKIMACLFYEPSTRTRFSFESAMKTLGGEVISTESAGMFSSAAKGESLADTVRVVSGYADVIVLRHNKEGSAKEAARYSRVPIINAGDGPGEHPTQALLDLYTINDELKRIDDLKIAFVGDLKYGRTVHSLVYLLANRKNVEFYFIAPQPVKLPEEIKNYLLEKNIKFTEIENEEGLEIVLRNCDVLYVTRIQKERFENEKEYEKCHGVYIIDSYHVCLMKKNSIIMHPLPRVDEISIAVDDDPRAVYFRQAANGKYIRMALLKMILDPENI
mgnify:CR=1 FL=1